MKTYTGKELSLQTSLAFVLGIIAGIMLIMMSQNVVVVDGEKGAVKIVNYRDKVYTLVETK